MTHDQEEALVMSDRIAVMSAGRLEQLGTPAELYRRPVNAFVASFLGESNLLPVRIMGCDAAGAAFQMEGADAVWSVAQADAVPAGPEAWLLVRP